MNYRTDITDERHECPNCSLVFLPTPEASRCPDCGAWPHLVSAAGGLVEDTAPVVAGRW